MPGEAPPVDGEGPPEGPASRDEDPPNDHAGTAAGWRRWVAAHGGELAIGLIGVLVGTALVWVVAPQQEVRSQRAVERDQRQRASQGPALTYTAAYRYFPEDSHAYVFPGKLPESMDSMLATQTIWDNIETIAREYDGQHLIYPRIRGLTGQETQMLTRIGVTLEGRRTDPVLIRSITARIVARHPPLSGTFFSIGAQGDGDIPQMMFDLDSADLAARMVGEDLMVGSRYDSTKYITLAKGEPIPLHFSAVTATCTCEFVIDLDLRSAGHDERLTIDDRGAPFRASSLARRYGREFVFVNMGGGMRSVPPKERKAT